MSQNHLIAEALAADPRIAQAKQLLLDAVEDHRKLITDIKPSNPELKKKYEELLTTYARYRGSKLWFPYLGSGMGNGPFVELADGSVKYDFISGIGPHYWGHSHLGMISAAFDASYSNTIMQGNLQQNVDSLLLTELLIKLSHLDHCFLSTTGAMANENAIKLTLQNKWPASRILAFERCFMGRTLVTSQITDRPAYRDGLPLNIFVDYVPFYDINDPQGSTQRAIDVLNKHLSRYPKEHAMMCFELIQGDGGFYAGSHDFFIALIEILKKHEIAVFIDEVQTFGRTSQLFAFQHFQLESYVDVVSIGKMSQVCATLFTEKFKPRPGLLSQTFTGSTSAIKAGYRMISSLIDEGFFGSEGKINRLSAYLISKLQDLASRYPDKIQGPFGMGTMVAFTPFQGNAESAAKLTLDLFDAGVLSFITGSNPTRVRFLIPPGVVQFHDIDRVISILEQIIKR